MMMLLLCRFTVFTVLILQYFEVTVYVCIVVRGNSLDCCAAFLLLIFSLAVSRESYSMFLLKYKVRDKLASESQPHQRQKEDIPFITVNKNF
jgi:hypothetical protein